MKKIKNKVLNVLMYVMIIIILVSLLYIRYLLLVNDGEALSIRDLKTKIIKERADKYKEIVKKDSIILQLELKIENIEENIEEKN